MSLKYLVFKNWGTLRELPAIVNHMIEETSSVRASSQTKVLEGRNHEVHVSMYIYNTVSCGNENPDHDVPLESTSFEI